MNPSYDPKHASQYRAASEAKANVIIALIKKLTGMDHGVARVVPVDQHSRETVTKYHQAADRGRVIDG